MFFLSWVTGLGGETITSTVSSGVDVLPVRQVQSSVKLTLIHSQLIKEHVFVYCIEHITKIIC